MNTFKRYAKLYRVFIIQFYKTLMQSKIDFWTGLIGFFFTQMAGIAFLYLVFRQIPTLHNWTFHQLIFIYGFAQIPRGVDHLFTDNLWMIAWRYVVNGQFDRYLLRPMNLFFQIISEKLQPDALGELAVGIILVVLSEQKGVISLSPVSILALLISVLAGSIIYTSIKLFFAAFAFWIKMSGPFLQLAYNSADLAKFPIEIYPGVIKFFISWVIPFAFVAYYPATYFLKDAGFISTIGKECLIAVAFWLIAYWTFHRGTKQYESAGN